MEARSRRDPDFEKGRAEMGDARKASKPGTTEKLFDRLTVLIMNHELLLNGTYGPLNAEQQKILTDLVARSKDIAVLVRELTDP